MPFQMFHDLFPDLAEQETRCITVMSHADAGLPPGDYYFHEMFCNEQGCDCRRVFLFVVSSVRKDVETVIAWGWEKPAFYAKWLGQDDPHLEGDEEDGLGKLTGLVEQLFRDAKVGSKRTNRRGQGYSIAEDAAQQFLHWEDMPWE